MREPACPRHPPTRDSVPRAIARTLALGMRAGRGRARDADACLAPQQNRAALGVAGVLARRSFGPLDAVGRVRDERGEGACDQAYYAASNAGGNGKFYDGEWSGRRVGEKADDQSSDRADRAG